jgi:hypothetical protein
MKNFTRLLIVLLVAVAFVVIAGQKAAWASPPPPVEVTGTNPLVLGGCVTGSVKDMIAGVKLNAALLDGWNSYPTDGLPPMPEYYWSLPGGPADIFSCVVNIKLMENNQLVQSLSQEKGTAEVCILLPSNKGGSIYFLDKFFNDKPAWTLVGGPFTAGSIGCVPAKNSGVYAIYAPDAAGHPAPTTPAGTTITTVTYTQVGSVLVPKYTTTITKPGPLVLGGGVTGNVSDLPDGNRLDAALVSSWAGLPVLPAGVGEFYRSIAQLKFYEGNTLVSKLATDKGYATICFAVPPQKNGTIYFLDKFFDPKADWVSIAGPFPTGIACGPADQSGLYGMVDTK